MVRAVVHVVHVDSRLVVVRCWVVVPVFEERNDIAQQHTEARRTVAPKTDRSLDSEQRNVSVVNACLSISGSNNLRAR